MLRRSVSDIVTPSFSSAACRSRTCLRQLLDVGVARGELLLELLLRALRRRGLAEQALGVDEADLVVGSLRGAGAERRAARRAPRTARRDAMDAAVQVDSPAHAGSEHGADLELEVLDLVAAACR